MSSQNLNKTTRHFQGLCPKDRDKDQDFSAKYRDQDQTVEDKNEVKAFTYEQGQRVPPLILLIA